MDSGDLSQLFFLPAALQSATFFRFVSVHKSKASSSRITPETCFTAQQRKANNVARNNS